MKKLLAALIAAVFATATVAPVAFAAENEKATDKAKDEKSKKGAADKKAADK